MKKAIGIAVAMLLTFGSVAQEPPVAPDVNQVIEDMAAVGPEALLSRVKELRNAEQALQDEAAALRAQADQKDAEAAAARARIEAVERFTDELSTAMAPPPEPEAPAVTAPEAPAMPEAPLVAAPEIPMVPEAIPEPAVAEPVEAEAAQVSAEPEEESMGMNGSDNQM